MPSTIFVEQLDIGRIDRSLSVSGHQLIECKRRNQAPSIDPKEHKERYGVTYDPAHLSRKLRASGMYYAKLRLMDPRSPKNADEILAERLGEALGEKDTDEQEDDPVVLGFFR